MKTVVLFTCMANKPRDWPRRVISILGFDDRPEKPWKSHWKDGYTFEEMVAAFIEGSKTLLTEVTGSTPREQFEYTVMIHDWGSQ
ncbi:expressed unknown protein [Seminavis robusta]|uniref:Uncharacterized protein n=1 Tax=Seminavis robusta TaxID=568900 RepID=A0A9N8ERN7_9STRA|nr:expressed unknown protein [Seminavis robusta]|eukprot:Sro1900_g304280.1 n/a (85) ;mRNA; r:18800-19141